MQLVTASLKRWRSRPDPLLISPRPRWSSSATKARKLQKSGLRLALLAAHEEPRGVADLLAGTVVAFDGPVPLVGLSEGVPGHLQSMFLSTVRHTLTRAKCRRRIAASQFGPFVWTADADLILGKVQTLCTRIGKSGH